MFFKLIFYFCLLICVFVLLCFWCYLCFLCVRNLFVNKKIKSFKTALITSFILLRRSATIKKNLPNVCFDKESIWILSACKFCFIICFDLIFVLIYLESGSLKFSFPATCSSLSSCLRIIFQIQIPQYNWIGVL